MPPTAARAALRLGRPVASSGPATAVYVSTSTDGRPSCDRQYDSVMEGQDPSQAVLPARDHRPAERVMKGILIAAAVVGVPVLLFMAFVIGIVALSG
jgi:hypothetical protein